MKLFELFENLKNSVHESTDDEAERVAPLKNLSKHNHHGRAFIDKSSGKIDAVLDAIKEGGDGDVLVWHDWYNDTTYEITIAGTSKSSVIDALKAIKKVAPGSHVSYAYATRMVELEDWRPID